MDSAISGYRVKVRQDDAVRAGERDRVLAEVRRDRTTVHPHARRRRPGASPGPR
jgi:hypothetical protein